MCMSLLLLVALADGWFRGKIEGIRAKYKKNTHNNFFHFSQRATGNTLYTYEGCKQSSRGSAEYFFFL
jgi:hypothetical protein